MMVELLVPHGVLDRLGWWDLLRPGLKALARSLSMHGDEVLSDRLRCCRIDFVARGNHSRRAQWSAVCRIGPREPFKEGTMECDNLQS